MHWNIDLSTEFDGLEIVVLGTFSLGNLLDLVDELLNHPQWSPGTATLWDYDHCSFDTISGEEMAEVAHLHHERAQAIGNGPSALLAPSLIQYADCRPHQSRLGNSVQSTIAVFRDRQKAVDWINQ